MTSNEGADNVSTPMIPFKEFLIDSWNGTASLYDGITAPKEFQKLVQEMEQNEMSRFPLHMQELFVNDVQEAFRQLRGAHEGLLNDDAVYKAAKERKFKCAVCEKKCKTHCAKCKSVFYCCAEHQSNDWEFHKVVCKVLRRFPENGIYRHETDVPNFA